MEEKLLCSLFNLFLTFAVTIGFSCSLGEERVECCVALIDELSASGEIADIVILCVGFSFCLERFVGFVLCLIDVIADRFKGGSHEG